MDYRRKPYVLKDKRIGTSFCIYCGEIANTREHLPSKSIANDENIIVPSCKKCNNMFSYDEKYLNYVLKSIMNSLTDEKDSRMKKLVLHELLGNGYLYEYNFQYDRIKSIILKYAYGHLISELGLISKGYYNLFLENVECEIFFDKYISKEQKEHFFKLYEYKIIDEMWGRECMIILNGIPYYFWKNRGPDYKYLVVNDNNNYLIRINIYDQIYALIDIPTACFN